MSKTYQNIFLILVVLEKCKLDLSAVSSMYWNLPFLTMDQDVQEEIQDSQMSKQYDIPDFSDFDSPPGTPTSPESPIPTASQVSPSMVSKVST